MIKWLIVVTYISMSNPSDDATIDMATNFWGGSKTPDVVASYSTSLEECESKILKKYQEHIADSDKWKLNKVDRNFMSLMDFSGRITQESSLALYFTDSYVTDAGEKKMRIHFSQCVPIVYR